MKVVKTKRNEDREDGQEAAGFPAVKQENASTVGPWN